MGQCMGNNAAPVLQSVDLEGTAAHLKAARNVIVLLGAGASTSCGIPDFRTRGSGLYDNLDKYDIPRPEAIFDIEYFQQNPSPFYQLVQELWPGKHQPSATHFFVKLLSDKGLLRRCYTQNIDSLETVAGVPAKELVAAHGNFDGCHVVGKKATPVPTEELKEALLEGRAGWERLRDKYDGLVKPDIVFFGEDLPTRFKTLHSKDFAECDLLVVAGTSLKVRPFSGLIGTVARCCPRLLLNRDKVGLADKVPRGFKFDDPRNTTDVFCEGDCDSGVLRLCELCGWEEDLKKLMNVL